MSEHVKGKKWYFTNSFIDYIKRLNSASGNHGKKNVNKENKSSDSEIVTEDYMKYAVIIVPQSKLGWVMGNCFPFEVGVINIAELDDYGDFTEIKSPMIPKMIRLFVDKEIAGDLPDEVIIDHIHGENIEFSFIPIMEDHPESRDIYYPENIGK